MNTLEAEYYNSKNRTKKNKDTWVKFLKKDKKKKERGSNVGKTKTRMIYNREPDGSDEYESDYYTDEDDRDSWGSGGDSWTMVPSRDSSFGPYPPPPIRVDTPPIDLSEFSVLQRPKQYSFS